MSTPSFPRRHRGSGCADRPPGLLARVAGSSGRPTAHRSAREKREPQRSPAITNPHGPSHPQPVPFGWKDRKEPQQESWGDWLCWWWWRGMGWGWGVRSPLLQGPGSSLTSLLISVTSVTHWPRLFNISWSVEPAPCPSPLCLSAAPPWGIPVSELLNY